MVTHKQLNIGLFGFGVVGEGLYKVLQQTPSLKAQIKKVCIKHPGKKRNAPAELFTTEKRSTKQVRLGFVIDRVLIKRET